MRTCAPASDVASLAVGDVREALAHLGAPAEEQPFHHAHVRLDASSGHADSHRTITPVAGSEGELVDRAAAGDVEAFGQLVRACERRVASVLYRLLDDRRDVEEATQDVFVQAWRNLHRYRGDAKFFTWLYRIAVNEALMRLDRLRIFSRRQLEHVLRVYARHYNQHRPHRTLALHPPEQADGNPAPLRAPPYPQPHRRDLLGGLIHEYEQAA
jgi:RNA polymerase sigma factor (sigma-70 family)